MSWRPLDSTFGGGVHQSAIIGHAPEHRDWRPGDPCYAPVLGEGVRIEAYVTIDAGLKQPTVIGARTWCMKQSHVGHDAQIGEDCEISPHVTICGGAIIGDGVKIGVNACVLPYRVIGAGVRIGAGAVVTKDFPDGVLVGNPARPLVANIPHVYEP